MDDFKEALNADVVLPVTPETIYSLRQRIVRLEGLLKESRDLLWHNSNHESGQYPVVCPGCALEEQIDEVVHGN